MTKKMLKKVLSLLLAALILCSLCACGEKSESKQNKDDKQEEQKPAYTSELAKEAYALIESGDYQAAYDLLKDAPYTSENKDALLLRDHFAFVPTLVKTDDRDYIRLVFDENGRIASYYVYDPDNRSTYNIEYYTYTYDENGNVLSEQREDSRFVRNYDEENDTYAVEIEKDDTYETVYTYDKNGLRLTEEGGAYSYPSKDTYTYDEQGRLTKETSVHYEGGPGIEDPGERVNETVYVYSDDGKSVTQIYTDEEGDEYSTTYTISETGWLAAASSDGYTVTFAYNEMGDLVSGTNTYEGETEDRCSLTYDKNGNLLTYNGGFRDAPVVFTYDEDGNRLTWQDDGQLVSYKYTDGTLTAADGDGDRVTYTCDEYGNVIEMVSADGTVWTLSWELRYYPMIGAEYLFGYQFDTKVEEYFITTDLRNLALRLVHLPDTDTYLWECFGG